MTKWERIYKPKKKVKPPVYHSVQSFRISSKPKKTVESHGIIHPESFDKTNTLYGNR